MGQADELHTKLLNGTLTKQDVLDVYINNFFENAAMFYLENSCERWEVFAKRRDLLTEAFKLHYEGRFISSIPLLISQFEGMLRDYGGLKNKDSIRGVIPLKIWEEEAAYFIEDDARHFNEFTNKLFAGQKGEAEFNRNTILHGFNITYGSKEHSLLMVLAIIEIRYFLLHYDVSIKNPTANFKNIVRSAIQRACKGNVHSLIGHQIQHEGCNIDIVQYP